MTKNRLEFPDGFVWGTATAGHQIEGHNDKSDWWKFEQEGKIDDGTVSGASVDYWNRYEEDHELMVKLGYKAFRLGIEWAKIEPEDGRFDMKAVEHYRKILQSLRDKNITICLTMYHWVLPLWFAEGGGWLRKDATNRFMKFAELIVKELGEFPDMWVTLNEPTVPTSAGYFAGLFPPEKTSMVEFLKATHALMRTHAECYHLIHKIVPKAPGGQSTVAGIAHAYQAVAPFGSPGIAGIFEKVMAKFYTFFSFKSWDQALAKGSLPFPFGIPDISMLKDTLDYCGVNYYTRYTPKFDKTKTDQMLVDIFAVPDGVETTQMGWQVYPEGFHEVLMYVWKTYNKPMYILENGIADDTDIMRSRYTLEHLAQINRAIKDGADIRGYYHWSFMDNFEWKEGFAKQFGLIACDHADPKLERRPRPSAHMYSDIISENAITPEIISKYAPDASIDAPGT